MFNNDDPMVQAATHVVKTLQDNGFEAYFVGGCVRNALLTNRGRSYATKDIDIATNAKPDQVISLFGDANLVGASFGVVIVKHAGFHFDVATFRSDGQYSDCRRPDSVMFGTIHDDAKRRDFSWNALYWDPIHNKLLDPFASGGEDDILNMTLNTVGSPADRFREDALRILRAFRFSSTYGFMIHDRVMHAIEIMRQNLLHISAERIRDEMTKILQGQYAVQTLRRMAQSHVLEIFLPEMEATKGCTQDPWHHPEGDVWTHTCYALSTVYPRTLENVWAVFLHDVGKPTTRTVTDGKIQFLGHAKEGARLTRDIMTRLRFSNEQIETVAETVYDHMMPFEVKNMNKATIRRFIAKPHFKTIFAVHVADCASSNGDMSCATFLESKILEFENEPVIPPPLIGGNALIALGLKPGPIFKKILAIVQTAQLNNEISTVEEALQLVKTIISQENLDAPSV